MALVDTFLAAFPAQPTLFASGTASGFTFDASTDAMALIFKVPKTGTIANVHYRVQAVSSPVMTHRIELRTVSATTGQPDGAGSLYGSSTSITVNAATYGANTNYTAAVNATGATKSDVAAIVCDLSAYTSGNFTQVQRVSESLSGSSNGRVTGFPYGMLNASASAVLNTTPPHGFALEYSGGVFVPIDLGNNWVGTVGNTTVTSTGAVRRAANIFRPTTKRRVTGIRANCDNAGDVVFRLRLASDDSILATASADANQYGGTAQQYSDFLFDSGTTVELTVGTDYYISMEGADATGGILYMLQAAPSNDMLDIMPGGKLCYGNTHNGTSWSAANTTRYDIMLLSDQEDDGSGGSGGAGSIFKGGIY